MGVDLKPPMAFARPTHWDAEGAKPNFADQPTTKRALSWKESAQMGPMGRASDWLQGDGEQVEGALL